MIPALCILYLAALVVTLAVVKAGGDADDAAERFFAGRTARAGKELVKR